MTMRLGRTFGLILLALMTLAAAPAHAEWRKAESARFIIYSEGSESELRAYAAKLETYDHMLRSRFGLRTDAPVPRKLPIYLVSAGGLQTIVPQATRTGIAGLYIATSEDIFAIALRSGGEEVLLHEYFHHFMLENFAAAYPAWLVEGFAEYYSTAVIAGSTVEVGRANRNVAEYLARSEWLSLETLLSQRPIGLRAANRDTYYPLSWLLTHRFLSNPTNSEQLATYMQAVARGGDPVTAMTEATGLSMPDLERDLRRHLRNSLPFVRLSYDFTPPPVQITRLPRSADDLLLVNQRLKIGMPSAARDVAARNARTAAAKHSDDPLALLALGHAELHFGDKAAGEATLTRLLEIDPGNIEAMQLLAQTRLTDAREADDPAVAMARLREARAFATKAYGLDNGQYGTIYLLALTREGAQGYPTGNDINTWLVAAQLAPQLAEIRIGAAQALMLAGRYPEAVVLLGPVASSPHGGGATTVAQKLIEAAKRGEAPPADLGVPDEEAENTGE